MQSWTIVSLLGNEGMEVLNTEPVEVIPGGDVKEVESLMWSNRARHAH